MKSGLPTLVVGDNTTRGPLRVGDWAYVLEQKDGTVIAGRTHPKEDPVFRQGRFLNLHGIVRVKEVKPPKFEEAQP